jgi:protein involved in polysaccharide export with SLBB domain
MRVIRSRFFATVLVFLISIGVGFGQDLLNNANLSQVRVDQISDAELIKYRQQVAAAGLTEAQAEGIAISRGMQISEVTKLRQRLAFLSTGSSSNNTNNQGNTTTNQGIRSTTTDTNATVQVRPINPRIFGSELFTTTSLTFQPDIRIATPLNYELGPDDELNVTVYGLQEASHTARVTPDGTITLPHVGEIKVTGLTFEEASARIRARMATIYTSLRSGASKLGLSLAKIRSIRVTILGATKPGTYTVSSLSTLFNVLYLAGGPSENGSYRSIELIRNNKVDRVVDLYTFLTTGSDADDVRLRENDIIRIPVYQNRVDITGEVKRNGIFEILPGETLSDLIRFASGFTDSAYRASIKVIQLTERERRVQDIPAAEFNVYKPSTGDIFTVSKILNRIANRVTLTGAVSRPGIFEATKDLTIASLIRRADGLREDAFTGRGQLSRVKEDLTVEIIPFDVKQVLAGIGDIPLQPDDVVTVFSIFDLRDEYTVLIQGEVRRPGPYPISGGLTLKDLVLQAGGFTDAAYPQRIEVARLIRRDTLTARDTRLSQIINITDANDLSISSNNIKLEPFDVVTIRRMPGAFGLESVEAQGQFQFPGPYVLQRRAERVSDLVKRAGGFAPEAFPDGGYLRRRNEQDLTTAIETEVVDKIQKTLKDSTGQTTGQFTRLFDQIPLDLRRILANPGSESDLILKGGDVLFVPRNDLEIRITGEVLYPTQATFSRTNNLRDYIASAGGFTDNARKKRVYVLYANGKAAKTKSFLGIKTYPVIRPGSEIIVPGKITRERRNNSGEIALYASVLASIAGIVIAVLNLNR